MDHVGLAHSNNWSLKSAHYQRDISIQHAFLTIMVCFQATDVAARGLDIPETDLIIQGMLQKNTSSVNTVLYLVFDTINCTSPIYAYMFGCTDCSCQFAVSNVDL